MLQNLCFVASEYWNFLRNAVIPDDSNTLILIIIDVNMFRCKMFRNNVKCKIYNVKCLETNFQKL